MKVAYDFDLDVEEWREMNFSEEQLAAARSSNTKQPTAKELIAAAQKYGPDGILESAILLTQYQYKEVEVALAKMEKK